MMPRKIDPQIWNDSRFRALSDDGKLAYLFITTHPAMTPVGAMRASVEGLAAEMGWDKDRMEKAIAEAVEKGMIAMDRSASFVAVKDYLRYNSPDGPNAVVRSWPEAFASLPECELRRHLAVVCRALLEKKGSWGSFLRTKQASDLINTLAFYAKAEPQSLWDEASVVTRRRDDDRTGERKESTGNVDVREADGDSRSQAAVVRRIQPLREVAVNEGADRPTQPAVQPAVWLKADEGRPTPDRIMELQKENQTKRATRLKEDFIVPETWIKAAHELRPDLSMDYLETTVAPNFVRYWSSKPGDDGYSHNWYSTWLRWCSRENGSGRIAKTESRYLDPSQKMPLQVTGTGSVRRISFMPRAQG